MKFLFDTNVLIPAEPTSPEHIESETPVVTQLLGLLQEAGFQTYIHPSSIDELGNDTNEARRNLRSHLVKKYVTLPSPPKFSCKLEQAFDQESSNVSSHDQVDNLLLAAVEADSVDYLVTNDHEMHKKAALANLQERVVSPADAIALVRSLLPVSPIPPPAVHEIFCHQLDENDPIFETLRIDYEGFDDWLKNCKREHRLAWVVKNEVGQLAGISIVKTEQTSEWGFSTPCLKLCTFKIADESRGVRFGELLLKAVFSYAFENSFKSMYVSIFPKYGELIALFNQFGFQAAGGQTHLGDSVFHKRLTFSEQDYHAHSPIEFNRLFGPFHVKVQEARVFIVPIQPQYHNLLFPDLQEQSHLFPGTKPFGNSIRKAYLSHSPNRQLAPGDLMLFYRSGGEKSIICLGVVEETLVSEEPERIIHFVGKRTVYPFEEIKQMCHSPVLGILFRQARVLEEPISLSDLKNQNLLKAAPQSITELQGRNNIWLRHKLEV